MKNTIPQSKTWSHQSYSPIIHTTAGQAERDINLCGTDHIQDKKLNGNKTNVHPLYKQQSIFREEG